MYCDNIDKYLFSFRYVQIRSELSSTAKRYIETLFSFTTDDQKLKKNIIDCAHNKKTNKCKKITNEEMQSELLKLKVAIECLKDSDDYLFLSQKYEELVQMVANKQNYIDLLIRLTCAAGVYPNDFFLNRAQQIFASEVYIPFVSGTFMNQLSYEKPYVKKIAPVKSNLSD